MASVNETLSQIATTALQIMAPVALAYLGYLAKKLLDWIDAKTKNEKLAGLNDRLDAAVTTAVQAVEQALVKQLDKKTPMDGVVAKTAAIASVWSMMPNDDLAAMKTTMGLDDNGLKAVIADHVEAAVGRNAKTAPEPAATAGARATLAAASNEGAKS